MPNTFRRLLTSAGDVLSRPIAFAAAAAFVAFWIVWGWEDFDLHSAATAATLFMTFFIERTSRRDTQALHAKIDELIKATEGASNAAIALDDDEPEDIEGHRARNSAARGAQF